jgi:excisionase family DNA binding protein
MLDWLIDLVLERFVPPIAAELATALPKLEPINEPWRLLTVDDVATRLGRSTRWVRERVKQGELPFVRLDAGALAFELEDVQAFARSRRISARESSVLAARLHDHRNSGSQGRFERRERAMTPGVGE